MGLKRLPAREATVDVVLTDGQRFSQHVSAVRGTAQNPMTRDEVVGEVPRPNGRRCWGPSSATR